MSNDDSIREIVNHYGDAEESSSASHRLGFNSSGPDEELILRHRLHRGTIIDAGGGAGAYACWLPLAAGKLSD